MLPDPAHNPFLKAILEDVEDDAPRLVYADWLEERGDPRGEFIRVQCQLDKLPANDTARSSLLEQEQLLVREHGADWLADLPPFGEQLKWEGFHRGFPVATIAFWTGELNLDQDSNRFAQANTRKSFEHFVQLARMFNWFVNQGNPTCMRLDAAVDSYRAEDCALGFLERVGGSPHLAYVIKVNTTNTRLTNNGVKALATSAHFRTHLRLLDLTCGYDSGAVEPNDEAVEALAGSARMTYLRELILDECWYITDRGAHALAASPNLGQLTRLVVRGWSDSMSKEEEQALQARFGDRAIVNWG